MASCGGSSPLMRGKRDFVRACDLHGRLIPAHAGKTRLKIWRTCPRRAHPRSCGENFSADSCVAACTGSSPLMRGKRKTDGVRGHSGGLIPAHAGKTGRGSQRARATRAHPHSRGENYRLTIDRGAYTGSSPLMRGKPSLRRPRRGQNGLIPTHAGKTPNLSWRKSRSWAHPRSRGENSHPHAPSRARIGSSPLTRGKPRRFAPQLILFRLIPAHAGKTSPTATWPPP